MPFIGTLDLGESSGQRWGKALGGSFDGLAQAGALRYRQHKLEKRKKAEQEDLQDVISNDYERMLNENRENYEREQEAVRKEHEIQQLNQDKKLEQDDIEAEILTGFQPQQQVTGDVIIHDSSYFSADFLLGVSAGLLLICSVMIVKKYLYKK